MILIVGVRRRARRRARRRVRLLIIVRQLHAGHPDGASHVFVYTVALTRAAGRWKITFARKSAACYVVQRLIRLSHVKWLFCTLR